MERLLSFLGGEESSFTFPSASRALDMVYISEKKERVVQGVNAQAKDFHIYDTNYHLHPDNNLTFQIGVDSFELPFNVVEKLPEYGKAISAYYLACDKLFKNLPAENKWKRILTKGKPNWLIKAAEKEGDEYSHIFLRPDFIITENGVATTEIETSPFGLALSYFLNKAYSEQDCDTLVDPEVLLQTFIEEIFGENPIGKRLCFVLTNHTNQYKGQFEFLGRELRRFGIKTVVSSPEDMVFGKDGCVLVGGEPVDCVYRGFYLHETVNDPRLQQLVTSQTKIMPGLKFHLEEKAIMGLVWDDDLRSYFEDEMGEKIFSDLRDILPKTYVLEEESLRELGLNSWEDIAEMSRKKRSLILKISGFSNQGSWAKGITFLARLSKVNCERIITEALKSKENFIIQEFKKGAKFNQEYYDFHTGSFVTMRGKVRFTPYFCAKTGKLLTAKSTMCPDTDFIHATSNSINSPVK